MQVKLAEVLSTPSFSLLQIQDTKKSEGWHDFVYFNCHMSLIIANCSQSSMYFKALLHSETCLLYL